MQKVSFCFTVCNSLIVKSLRMQPEQRNLQAADGVNEAAEVGRMHVADVADTERIGL